MVAIVKNKLFTGKTKAQELSDDFRKEISEKLKQAAHDNHCNVEDLKFSVNNIGVVNIRSLTPEEIFERDFGKGKNG